MKTPQVDWRENKIQVVPAAYQILLKTTELSFPGCMILNELIRRKNGVLMTAVLICFEIILN